MKKIVEHLRVQVFENGAFLKNNKFETIKGIELDNNLLDIGKVRFAYSWRIKILIEELHLRLSYLSLDIFLCRLDKKTKKSSIVTMQLLEKFQKKS